MLMNDLLEKQHMTKYRLSKESGAPQATINDICSGKADLEKCLAGTLYRLAMLDYLSRENNIPICTRYDDIRARRLSKPIYPVGVLLTSKVLKSEEPLRKAEKESIPEFSRFNIIENEVRNVV